MNDILEQWARDEKVGFLVTALVRCAAVHGMTASVVQSASGRVYIVIVHYGEEWDRNDERFATLAVGLGSVETPPRYEKLERMLRELLCGVTLVEMGANWTNMIPPLLPARQRQEEAVGEFPY